MANPKRQPLKILQCLACGTEFQQAHGGQKYCSEACCKRFNYQSNRQKFINRACSRQAAQRKYVNADKLEACLEDPRKAWTIAGPDVIVCLECGVKLKELGHHVNEHGMTVAEYKRKPAPGGHSRYNSGRSLSSITCRESRSKKAKSRRTVDQLAGHRLPVQHLIQSRGPRKVSFEARLDMRDARKGKTRPDMWKRTPEGKVATDASIAKLRLEGMTGKDIAQRVGLKGNASILLRLHEMGFSPGRPCLFRYGKPITGRHIRDLCSDFGMTRKKMAEEFRVPYSSLDQRAMSDGPTPVRFAKLVIRARQKLAEQCRHQSATKQGGRPPLIRPSQEISICASYKELIHDLKILQKWLKQKGKDVSIPMVWTWLCERSRDGTIRLLFWPEFLKWVTTDSYIDTKQLNHHSGGKLTETYTLPQVLAQNFLAKSYSVSEEKIRHILKQGSPKQQAKKRLLEGALTVFNGQKNISSAELVIALKESGHSSYKNLTQDILATRLGSVGVGPGTVRLSGKKTLKGYKRKDLEQALSTLK